MIVTMIVHCETSGVQAVISHIDHASARMPPAINMRGSIRFDSRPPVSIAVIVPMPRGAMISPAASTG